MADESRENLRVPLSNKKRRRSMVERTCGIKKKKNIKKNTENNETIVTLDD